VGSMSGGEKARLVLCMIVWQRPNLLLLDEPTNHLDLATREALSMALNEFEGTVMLVSHDRALLRAVCDEFWLVSHGGVEPFDGDLDDYQRYLLDEAKRQRESLKEASNPAGKKNQGKSATGASGGSGKKRQSPEEKPRTSKREIDQIETRMATLNHEGAALEVRLAAQPLAAEIAELGKRLKVVNSELQQLEDQWLELSSKVESTSA
jgi:ATP-binding cassette subfamily F protein 3